MEKFSELSGVKQWGLLVAGAALLPGAAYFFQFKSQADANATAQQALDAKLQENRELESYKPRLAEMDRQVASLKQQLEIEQKIVPDAKEVPGFMTMLDDEAQKAGIEIRRYTAQPTASKEFYTEVPVRYGIGWALLLGAELLRPGEQAGADRECFESAGGQHQASHRRQDQAHVSVRTQ